MAFVVRPSSIEDYESINALGRWFQENSLYANCGWSDQKSFALVQAGSDPASSTFMRVVEKEGQIVGFFLGYISEYFFSEKKIAQDMVMVFSTDQRDGIGKPTVQVLREFVNWATGRGANEVCIGITSGIAGAGYEKLVLKNGFKKVGIIMKKEV